MLLSQFGNGLNNWTMKSLGPGWCLVLSFLHVKRGWKPPVFVLMKSISRKFAGEIKFADNVVKTNHKPSLISP